MTNDAPLLFRQKSKMIKIVIVSLCSLFFGSMYRTPIKITTAPDNKEIKNNNDEIVHFIFRALNQLIMCANFIDIYNRLLS